MLRVSFPNGFALDVVICGSSMVGDGARGTCWTSPVGGSDPGQCISAGREANMAFLSSLPAPYGRVRHIAGGAPDWVFGVPPTRRASTNNLLEAVA